MAAVALALRFALESTPSRPSGSAVSAGDGGITGAAYAGAAIVVLVVNWAWFIAPRSTRSPLPIRWRTLAGAAVMLLAAALLAVAGEPLAAAVFAAIVVVGHGRVVRARRGGPGLAGAAGAGASGSGAGAPRSDRCSQLCGARLCGSTHLTDAWAPSSSSAGGPNDGSDAEALRTLRRSSERHAPLARRAAPLARRPAARRRAARRPATTARSATAGRSAPRAVHHGGGGKRLRTQRQPPAQARAP